MSKLITRSAAAGIALAIGLTGVAQAAPLNIWSASKSPEASASVEQVQYRRHYRHRYYRHRHDDFPVGAAIAGGVIGLAAGAAIASQPRYYGDRYYYERPRYDYCNPPNRPSHYPAPAGC